MVARIMGLLIINWKVKDALVFWTRVSWTLEPHCGIKQLPLPFFMASKGLVFEETDLQLDPHLTTLKMKHTSELRTFHQCDSK